MGKNNFSEMDLSKIRMAMEFESWVPDPALPKNWLYKKRHMNNVYCAPNGKLMLSKDLAIEYLKTESKIPEDLLQMQMFQPPPGKRVHPQSKRSDTRTSAKKDTGKINQPLIFDEDISLLPRGWKILKDYDTQNRNVRIISPQGYNFRTKRSALAFGLHEGK